MGRITGDVDVLGIANLLQVLATNATDGILTVYRSDDRKSIEFRPQGIRLVALGRQKLHTLGEILIRSGKITRQQLDAILEDQRRSGKKLGEIVIGMGLLTHDDIDQSLREQAEEEIHDLFLWSNARFEFEQGGSAPDTTRLPLADVVLDSNLTSLMLEAARRADELNLIRESIPDDTVTPIRVAPVPPTENPNLDPQAAEGIYPFLDGTMTVGEIQMASLYPRFVILRTLFVLAKVGAIRIVNASGIEAVRPDPAPSLRLPKQAAPLHHSSEPRRTVLLVSGLPLFRTTLAASLRNSNYDVVEEELTTDLLRTAAKFRFDAVILDIALTHVDALKLCVPLKTATQAPVIVLSANIAREAVLKAIRAGARDYIVKPFKNEVLLDRLSQILKR